MESGARIRFETGGDPVRIVVRGLSLSRTHSHTHSLSLSLSHTHTHSLSQTYTHTHARTHTQGNVGMAASGDVYNLKVLLAHGAYMSLSPSQCFKSRFSKVNLPINPSTYSLPVQIMKLS